MQKKLISLLLALGFVFGTSACNVTPSTPSSGSDNTPTVSSSSVDAEDSSSVDEEDSSSSEEKPPVQLSAALQGSVLSWTDTGAPQYYELYVDGEGYTLDKDARSFDFAALELPSGIYFVSLERYADEDDLDDVEVKILFEGEYWQEDLVSGITTYAGSWKSVDGQYYSQERYSLALLEGESLSDGSLTAYVQANADNDCGLVFRCDTGDLSAFWEEKPATYYVALINWEGKLLLGKINGELGTWQMLDSKQLYTLKPSEEYEIKVELSGANIKLYVEGQLWIDFTDPTPLTGTGVGFRAELSNVIISDVRVKPNN